MKFKKGGLYDVKVILDKWLEGDKKTHAVQHGPEKLRSKSEGRWKLASDKNANQSIWAYIERIAL